jgi:RND family efflux transporter MFP subunit
MPSRIATLRLQADGLGSWLMKLRWRVLMWIPSAVGAAAVVIFLLLALAGVFHEKVGPAEGVTARDTLDRRGGEVVEVQTRELPAYEWAVGTVRAVHETTLGARLLSTVVRADVEAGQDVEAEQVLIVLDDRDLQAQLERAAAEVAAALATRDQAQSDYDRIASLAPEGGASPFELTTATNALRAAEAEHERALQAHREAQAVLSYATIRAPVAGRIVDKLVEVGDLVSPGQALVTMYDPTNMQLVATVRESLRQRLQVGQQVGVKLDVLDHVCEATIAEIVPRAAAASRSFEVKVVGPCPPGVYPGMFGRLRIPLGTSQVVCAPSEAIQRVGQLDLADVVEGPGSFHRRHVQIGKQLEGGDVEILSGLAAGEWIVMPSGGGGAGAEVSRDH